MLRKLMRDEEPPLLGIALDVSRATVRTEAYAEYKANRAPMPEDLKAQMPAIRRAIEAFRIPILELERYEADDVLGTLGRKAEEGGYDVTIVSADKDLFQLVSDRVSLLHTGREKTYDPALVEQDFGVPPGAGGRSPRPGRRQGGQRARRPGYRRQGCADPGQGVRDGRGTARSRAPNSSARRTARACGNTPTRLCCRRNW